MPPGSSAPGEQAPLDGRIQGPLLANLAQMTNPVRARRMQASGQASSSTAQADVGASRSASQSNLMLLPAELHEAIASRLDALGRAQYASAHPVIGRAVRHAVLADDLLRHAADMRSLGRLRQLLAATASVPVHVRPPSVFAALARRVAALPSSERGEAVAQLLNAQRDLPEATRATVLQVLGSEIRWLPAENQEPALNAVLDAAQTLPPRHQSAVVASIAPFVQNNTETAHRAYARLLSLGEQLEPPHRGPALSSLGALVERLPEPQRRPVFTRLLRMTLEMPATSRSDAIAALASQIHCVAAGERLTVFDQLRGAIAELRHAQRAQPSINLAQRIDWLEMDDRAAAFGHMLELTDDMPLDDQARTLAGLATRVGALAETSHALASLLARVEALPQQARTEPLGALRGHVQSWRQPGVRIPASRAVEEAIERLEPQHRPPAVQSGRRRFHW